MPRKTYRLKITSPELWQDVNPENKKLVNQFLREKNTRSSDTTIKGYKSDLEIFFTWNLLYNNNLFFIDIKKLQFAEFFSFATTYLRWGSSRFGRMRSVLSSLSIFIERFMDDMHPNFKNLILKTIEVMPKVARREKTVLSEEQVEGIFIYLEEQELHQINCWFALAVSSGSRFAELLRFTTEIIDENNMAFNNIFLETTRPVKSKGRTKEGKMLIKYIIKDIFWEHYENWINIRKDILDKNNKNHDYLFIKKNGDPAQGSTIRSWVKKIEKCLDVPFYPHCLRHYITTYLSKIGLPYNLIKEIFGWESIEMCATYDNSTAKDKRWDELDEFKKILDQK